MQQHARSHTKHVRLQVKFFNMQLRKSLNQEKRQQHNQISINNIHTEVVILETITCHNKHNRVDRVGRAAAKENESVASDQQRYGLYKLKAEM